MLPSQIICGATTSLLTGPPEAARSQRACVRQSHVRASVAASHTRLARLEARHMLTITVTDQNLVALNVRASYVFADNMSITMADDLVMSPLAATSN